MSLNGKIVWESLGSVVLKNNPLGDPRLREVPVYLPPSYPVKHDKRYPVIYYLTGFTGTPRGLVDAHPWKEGLFQRLDRLIAAKKVPECLMVVPDCFTLYGGSQYRNSEGTGRYEDHITQELVGYVDGKYRTPGTRAARAVMGKSSGGYGALWLGMSRPDLFAHVISHSGDMLFESGYAVEFPKAVNALAKWKGDFSLFLKDFKSSRDKMSFPHELINAAGMASSYSANPKSPLGFDLPFDQHTAELKPAVWERWLACDPVRLAKSKAAALKSLRTLYFDCGRKDEFFLHLGARALARELKGLKVPHTHEEHDLGHFNMAERYDHSLVLLGKAFGKR